MTRLVETIRASLGNRTVPSAELSEHEKRLVATVDKDSLGALISSAVAAKNQGRMDDAISQLTRANRKQLDAIEGIIKTLDTVAGRPKSNVVLAKFRQTPPFEMGVEGADDVLVLIKKYQDAASSDRAFLVENLHELETARNEELEALNFFRQRISSGGAETEIAEAERKLSSISEELERTKSNIVLLVLSACTEHLKDRFDIEATSAAHYEVAAWLYRIVTSKTSTRPASEVDVG